MSILSPTRIPHATSLALVLTLVASSPPALAEDAATEATRIFEAGREALTAGDAELACSKFTASQQLDPRVGTLLNLGLCHEEQGLLAKALDYWQQAEQLATSTGDERASVARERATLLESRVPTITLRLAANAPPESVVRWADAHATEPRQLATKDLGKPVRIEVGRLRLVVTAPGHEQRSYELDVGERDRTEMLVEPGPANRGSEPPSEQVVDQGATPASEGSPWSTAGFVVGGVGLAGLAIGAVFGGLAVSKQSESEQLDASGVPHCDGDNACSPEGMELRDDAITNATVSTAAFVAGGVLLAAGVVIVLAAPDGGNAEEATAGLSVRLELLPAGATMRGSW